MRPKIGFLVFLCMWNLSTSLTANELIVIYPKSQSERDPRQAYFVALLELALECTRGAHGDYQLTLYDEELPPTRVPILIQQDRLINIMSSPATEYLNTSMQAIPFPLLMGIQGIRVSFLHQDDSQRFSEFTQLSDFKKTIFGQGLGWLDTLILKDAKLNVDTSGHYESLFAMLSNKRIDAFPRGINEVLPELAIFKKDFSNIVIDPNVAFYYPLPVYFYVAKDNTILAERLLQGLTLAVKEGRFQQLFDQYYAQALDQLHLPKRKVFVLKNNYLPKDTESQIAEFLHPYIKNHFNPANESQPKELAVH